MAMALERTALNDRVTAMSSRVTAGGAAARTSRRRSSVLVPVAGRRGSQLEIYLLDEGCTVPSGEVLVELLDRVGFGWYQMLMMPLFLGVVMAEGAEMLITSSVGSGVREEFHLNETQQGTLSSCAFLGLALGTALSGAIADRYGRRVAIVGGYALMAIFGLMSAVAGSYSTLLALRILSGAACGMGFPAAITIMAEICPHDWRSLSFVIISFASTLGEVYGGFGLLIWMPDMVQGNWRLITLWGAVPALFLSVLSYLFLDESAHWLAVAGRLPEARDVLVKMARWNGSLEKIQRLSATVQASAQETEAAKQVAEVMASEATLSLREVLRLFASRPPLLGTLGVLSLAFTVGNILVFGMGYVWPRILVVINDEEGGDLSPALELIIIRSCGFLAALVTALAMTSSFGHREVIGAASFVCGGGLMWSYLVLQSHSNVLVAVGVLVLIASNTYYVALVTLSCESFPTVVRAIGVGAAITVGRVGAVITPLITAWFGVGTFLLMSSYLCCVAACLMLPLRETKGLPLDDFPAEPMLMLRSEECSGKHNYGSMWAASSIKEDVEATSSRSESEDVDTPEAQK